MGITYSRDTPSDVSNEKFENVEPNIFDISKDVACECDWTFNADTGVLPASTSLRMNMPREYGVDIQYSSISYAIAYVVSYDSVTLFRPSVEFIDKTMKSSCVNTHVSSRMAIQAFQEFGVCEETEYIDDDGFPSKECLLKAHNFNLIGYFKIRFGTIKKAVCTGYPVVLCVEIFNKNQIGKDSIIKPVDKTTSMGSIAVVVTGYDDRSESFEYINCVNSEWGTCDYSIIKTYGHSMWVVKNSKYEDILDFF